MAEVFVASALICVWAYGVAGRRSTFSHQVRVHRLCSYELGRVARHGLSSLHAVYRYWTMSVLSSSCCVPDDPLISMLIFSTSIRTSVLGPCVALLVLGPCVVRDDLAVSLANSEITGIGRQLLWAISDFISPGWDCRDWV